LLVAFLSAGFLNKLLTNLTAELINPVAVSIIEATISPGLMPLYFLAKLGAIKKPIAKPMIVVPDSPVSVSASGAADVVGVAVLSVAGVVVGA
jgi:hypothetical protein